MGIRRRRRTADDPAAPLPLADFVSALREELKAAHKKADPELPIEVGQVTVDFTLLTRKEAGGNAGVKFWVVNAGVTGKLANESTQKVSIELTPLDKTRRPFTVRDVDEAGSAQLPHD